MSLPAFYKLPESEAIEKLRAKAKFACGSAAIEGFGLKEERLFERLLKGYQEDREEFMAQGLIKKEVQ